MVNDAKLLDNDIKKASGNKFLSQEIQTHVVHFHPSKKDYLDLSTFMGGLLHNYLMIYLTDS